MGVSTQGLDINAEEGSANRELVVEPDNIDAVRVFADMSSQWNVTQLTVGTARGSRSVLVRTGLNYSALSVVAGALGVELQGDTLARLRKLQAETLAVDRRALRRL